MFNRAAPFLREEIDETAHEFRIALALAAGVILFTVCLSGTSKKFSRYLLPAFLLLEILFSVGFVQIFQWGYTRIDAYFRVRTTAFKNAFIAIVCLGFFIIQVLPVLALYPYYGTYYNLCWKVTDITKIITVGDASGVDLAAKYLNQKPDSANIAVQVSDLGSEFFRYYFKGTTYRTDKNRLKDIDKLPTTDYEVIYIRDSQIGWAPQEGIKGGTLEHVITLNGLNLVWVYRIKPQIYAH